MTLKPLESNVFWVRDLIDEESHKWNIHLLERTFNNYDIEKNLQIPLDNHDEENALMWMMSKKKVRIRLRLDTIGSMVCIIGMKLVRLSIRSTNLYGKVLEYQLPT